MHNLFIGRLIEGSGLLGIGLRVDQLGDGFVKGHHRVRGCLIHLLGAYWPGIHQLMILQQLLFQMLYRLNFGQLLTLNLVFGLLQQMNSSLLFQILGDSLHLRKLVFQVGHFGLILLLL
jgi:hypothetical protein